MKERDCANCKHHTEDGCSSWDCEFEAKDLISRADAIEAVMAEGRKVYTSEYANAERIIYEEDAVEALAMLPSAEAVQGEWQKVEEQPYFRKHYDTVCCSVCRKKGNRKWNFCPNCGARMTPYKGGDAE